MEWPFSRGQRILALLAGAVAVYAVVQWRATRLNTWPIANLPLAADAAIVCFGDSLVAGTGAESPERTYPAQLGDMLGRQVEAVGVPGMTAQGGLESLDDLPGLRACLVVVTLGGNDILQRLPWAQTEAALNGLFEALRRRGCVVAFTGVEGLLSGSRQARYRELCRKHGTVLVPDVMDGILNDAALKSDPVHPNGAGYRVLAERVAATLRPYLPGSAGR